MGSDSELVEAARMLLNAIARITGENVEREGLKRTPERVARALAEVLEGYTATVEPVLFHETASLVVLAGIPFASLCEHHLLPFIGLAHVAYVPRGKVIGASKIVRIVRMYARRLQIQERMTRQVLEEIAKATGSSDVLVVTEAVHTCMVVRGVRVASPLIVVQASGVFEKEPQRLEAVLRLIEPYRLRMPLLLST